LILTPHPSPLPQERALIGMPKKKMNIFFLSLRERLGEGSNKQYPN